MASEEEPVLPVPGTEADRKSYYGDTLQPWDLIKALGHGKVFCIDNVIKYVARAEKKNGLDDVIKARWYLNRLVELMEEEKQKASS